MTRNGSVLVSNANAPLSNRAKQANGTNPSKTQSNKPVTKSIEEDPSAVRVGKNIFFPSSSESPTQKYTTISQDKPAVQKNEPHIKHKLAAAYLERQQALKGEDAEIVVWENIQHEGVHTRKELEQHEKTKKYGVTLQPELVEGLSGADILVMLKRLESQQAQFRELERRDRKPKLIRIRSVHSYITNEEAMYALQQAGNDVEETIMRLTNFSFLQEIRKKIALTHNPIFSVSERAKLEAKSNEDDDDEEGDSQDDEDDEDYEQVFQVRSSRAAPKRKRSQDDTDDSKKVTRKGDKDWKRLRLDDAVKDSENMEGWSEARIKAWKCIDTNENAYYYRFNAPGEKQKNGSWSAEERKLFMQRLKECDIVGNPRPAWGTFSIPIEGRVGYQCSNFYRTLLKNGELKDPNYWLEGGQLHCVNGRGWKKRASEGHEMAKKKLAEKKKRSTPTKKRKKEDSETEDSSEEEDTPKKKKQKVAEKPKSKARKASKKDDDDDEEEEEASSAPPKKKQRKAAPKKLKEEHSETEESEDDDDDDDEAEKKKKTKSPAKKAAKPETETKTEIKTDTKSPKPKPSKVQAPPSPPPVPLVHSRNQNPLPGFLDPITQTEIEQPAISPHGYVAGYRTWLRILQQEPKNTCPFTKQRVNKRDLIRLNFDNIDEHRHKIKNMPQ